MLSTDDRKKLAMLSERELLMHLIERVETIADSQIDVVTRVSRLEVDVGIGPPSPEGNGANA